MRNIIVFLKLLVCHFLYYTGLLSVILKYFISKRKSHPFVIINYHRFVHNYDNIIEIHPSVTHLISDFKREIKFLKSYFDIISLDKAINKFQNKEGFDKPTVCITVDDGYKDNYDLLFPVLVEENVTATIFLSTGVIGTDHMNWYDRLAQIILHAPDHPFSVQGLLDEKTFQMNSMRAKRSAYVEIVETLKNMDIRQRDKCLKNIESCLGSPKAVTRIMLNWEEVRKMKEAGIAFGAHTHTHPILTRMPLEEAKKDILRSKQKIEQEFGIEVEHFAYPNGRKEDFNDDLREYCKEIGFSSISTLDYGNNKTSSDIWALKRISSESPVSLFSVNVIRAFFVKHA